MSIINYANTTSYYTHELLCKDKYKIHDIVFVYNHNNYYCIIELINSNVGMARPYMYIMK